METGSNKSLYTLIAVVVFGIFLSLSYYLYQDQLKSVLANVMNGTSVMTSQKLNNDGLIPTNSSLFTFNATTGEITSFETNGTRVVVIPKVINGVEVTSIGPSVFSNIQIDSVILPDSVVSIGINAFWNCGLTEIKLSDNLTTIGAGALAWNRLTNLVLPEKLTNLGAGSIRGNRLTTLKIPVGVTTLSTTMFSHNLFTHIELPKSFENSTELNSLIDYYSWDGTTISNITYFKNTKPNLFSFY